MAASVPSRLQHGKGRRTEPLFPAASLSCQLGHSAFEAAPRPLRRRATGLRHGAKGGEQDCGLLIGSTQTARH